MTVYSLWINILGEWEMENELYDSEEKVDSAAAKLKEKGWTVSTQSHEVL